MKTVQELPTLSCIKTACTVGASSIPKVERPGHLELYVLGMGKSRLLKEFSAVTKRKGEIQGHLNDLNERIKTLRKQVNSQQDNQHGEGTPEKQVKTMPMYY